MHCSWADQRGTMAVTGWIFPGPFCKAVVRPKCCVSSGAWPELCVTNVLCSLRFLPLLFWFCKGNFRHRLARYTCYTWIRVCVSFHKFHAPYQQCCYSTKASACMTVWKWHIFFVRKLCFCLKGLCSHKSTEQTPFKHFRPDFCLKGVCSGKSTAKPLLSWGRKVNAVWKKEGPKTFNFKYLMWNLCPGPRANP